MNIFRFSFVSVVAAVMVAAGCSKLSPENCVALGQKALEDGNYEESIRLLDRATSSFPKSYELWVNLGSANLFAGHNRAAEKAFSKAVELSDKFTDSSSTIALEYLAEARRRRGDTLGAIDIFERAIHKANRKPHLLSGRAACAMEMNRRNFGMAKELLEEANRLDSKDVSVVYNSAVLYANKDTKYFDQTTAAKQLFLFILDPRGELHPQSDLYLEQKREAVKKLAQLHKDRPHDLQMQIDDLMMKAHNSNLSLQESRKLIRRAYELDCSNATVAAAYLKACQASGNVDKLLLGFQTLFPDDPRFVINP